jgi:hypothetical protein
MRVRIWHLPSQAILCRIRRRNIAAIANDFYPLWL